MKRLLHSARLSSALLEHQRKTLEKEAKAMGMSMSAYIRLVAFGEPPKQKKPKKDKVLQ